MDIAETQLEEFELTAQNMKRQSAALITGEEPAVGNSILLVTTP